LTHESGGCGFVSAPNGIAVLSAVVAQAADQRLRFAAIDLEHRADDEMRARRIEIDAVAGGFLADAAEPVRGRRERHRSGSRDLHVGAGHQG